MAEGNTDYLLDRSDAEIILGLVHFEPDTRKLVLQGYVARHGADALANLMAQFIGLANSVADNCRTSIELFAIVDGDMHPDEAEKLNLPTIVGACRGAVLAAGIDPAGTCDGCAFRLGTHANQSTSTTMDADWCAEPGERPFMCHMDLDDAGEPTKACAGFALLRAAKRKAA